MTRIPARDVVITGIGVVSAIGVGAEQFWAALCGGSRGVRLIQAFDPSRFASRVAAEIDDVTGSAYFQPAWRLNDRSTQFALVAASEAITQARLDMNRIDPARCGTYVGTGVGGVGIHESECRRYVSGQSVRPLSILRVMYNASAAHIAAHHGFCGKSLTIATACASGSQAIGEASSAIQRGEADVIVAGGTDAPISEPLFAAWNKLRVLAEWDGPPAGACRPFSADRTGLVLGEGAAFLVLEAADEAQKRGAMVLGRIRSTASNTTISHLTTPDIAQETVVMNTAIAAAAVSPTDIVYVNAHGTGTLANDSAETMALRNVFGEGANRLQVSSGKAQYGHTLGAAGAFGVVTGVMTLRDGIVPPTVNLDSPDPACDLNYVAHTSQALTRPGCVLVNAFGFGGTNVSIVLDAVARV